MKNSLFIGNGLNRSINSSIEWGDLLQNIANEYDVEHNCNIALPLDFEIIANQISKKKRAKSKDIYKELKEKIADQIQKATLSESAPHYAFTDLPVDSIFTTNYDYLLESALDPKFDYAKNTHPVSSPNSMYNLITKRGKR